MSDQTNNEPTAECQRELVQALQALAEGGGNREGTQVWLPLETELSEYQWDRCWWNARWWARNEDQATYELFRLVGRGNPIRVEAGQARIEVDSRFASRTTAATEFRAGKGDGQTKEEVAVEAAIEDLVPARDRGPLEVRAIRFKQNERVFYSAVLPAAEVIDRSKVDVWSADAPEDEVGYQREPMSSRLREVANYMEKPDAIMPVGGLLNARPAQEGDYGKVLPFEPDPGQDGPIQSGTLTIPDEALPLWIVDMQHRLGGLGRAIFEDQRHDLGQFPMVATIADGLSKHEEIGQFELINTTQKKVRTDLARRLMAVQMGDSEKRKDMESRGRLWQARGPIVADWLNRRGEVWKGRIQPPNKSKKEAPLAVLRETSFVTSLKPILQQPLFQRMEEEQVAMLVDRYWSGLAEIWSDAFEHPADYVIQKTPGVFSLHIVLPEIVEIVRSRGQDLAKENLVDAMVDWRELGSDFWERGQENGASRYGSMAGFSRLAAELRESLPQVELGL